jgi:hypothetical protein
MVATLTRWNFVRGGGDAIVSVNLGLWCRLHVDFMTLAIHRLIGRWISFRIPHPSLPPGQERRNQFHSALSAYLFSNLLGFTSLPFRVAAYPPLIDVEILFRQLEPS